MSKYQDYRPSPLPPLRSGHLIRLNSIPDASPTSPASVCFVSLIPVDFFKVHLSALDDDLAEFEAQHRLKSPTTHSNPLQYLRGACFTKSNGLTNARRTIYSDASLECRYVI